MHHFIFSCLMLLTCDAVTSCALRKVMRAIWKVSETCWVMRRCEGTGEPTWKDATAKFCISSRINSNMSDTERHCSPRHMILCLDNCVIAVNSEWPFWWKGWRLKPRRFHTDTHQPSVGYHITPTSSVLLLQLLRSPWHLVCVFSSQERVSKHT